MDSKALSDRVQSNLDGQRRASVFLAELQRSCGDGDELERELHAIIATGDRALLKGFARGLLKALERQEVSL